MVMINTGSTIAEYSSDLYRAVDLKAQEMAEEAFEGANQAKEITEIVIILRNNGRVNINSNIISFNQDLIIFSPTEKIYLTPSTIAEMLGTAATYDS